MEELNFEQYSGPKPEFFGRCIDDCFVATSCSKPDFESFISYVNSFHPSLDFTWEIRETSVTFLDISVSITDTYNYPSTSVHCKPTDSHSYLLLYCTDLCDLGTWACLLAMPGWWGLKRPKQLSMAANIQARIKNFLCTSQLKPRSYDPREMSGK